jgi:membrane protease YdiL (CAAX protease family)
MSSARSLSAPPPAEPRIDDAAEWVGLVVGLFLVFGLFHGAATVLESDRGQRGILVGGLVVAATAAAAWFLPRQPRGTLLRRLGFGRPRAKSIGVAGGVTLLLLIVAEVFVRARQLSPVLYPAWPSLLPGLFAQAGIAEEVLFRGYLFGQVRVGRTFWRAAWLSMLPFVAVHLVLFFTMAWPIALASVALAVVISFPLAHLFELGGGTIWAPALLHFVVQATVKVVVFPDGAESFALAWMAASALVPLLVFTVKGRDAPFVRVHS